MALSQCKNTVVITTYCNTICYGQLELENLIHSVKGYCGVVVSMLAQKARDTGEIPLSETKSIFNLKNSWQ